jgi:L-ascorbate metabolism protein UlaG (beta-lactamase superfamily)
VAVDVALVHLGGVRFPVTGPLRFTMTGREAAELIGIVRPRVAVPVHYEGWAHFRQGRAAAERDLADAPEDVRRRVRWIPLGTPVDDL